MKSLLTVACCFFLLNISGCTAHVGSTLTVPGDAGQTCTNHCQSIGMHLSAVAIMANNVGCICEPATVAPVAGDPATTSPAPNDPANAVDRQASSTAGGMTAILIQEQERQQAQQN